MAGGGRRRGDRLRRGHGAHRDRGRQHRRLGGPRPAVRRTGRAAAGRHAGCGLGRAGAGRHRQRRGPAVGPGRAGELPAPPGAGGAAGRAEPAAGHRVRRDDPAGHPQRGDPAGPQVPVGRRLQPARLGVRSAPHPAQGQRGPDQHRQTASCSAPSITRSPFTGGAGPWSSIRTGRRPRGTRTRPRCCTATGHPPGPGNGPRSRASPSKPVSPHCCGQRPCPRRAGR